MFNGKRILVTGGTGSFGSALCRHIAQMEERPARLAVLSRGWLAQKALREELSDPDYMRWFIGDVRDKDRLMRALDGFDYCIHAAAMKDIISCEKDPDEAYATNVMGTRNVRDAALARGVEKVVLVSTDKASSPCTSYGFSKAAAESLMIQGNMYAGTKNIRFAAARYGNVAGSAGSVVPIFKKMLAEGVTELPITDPRMTRFWFPMEQAIDFVLKCLQRMQGGEIFIPMIPSIRMVDLVEAMAPGMSYKVIGLRQNEKIHEVLCPAETAARTLVFDDHFVITPSVPFCADIDYTTNPLGERGRPASEVVADFLDRLTVNGFGTPITHGWEYSSGTNGRFLSVEEIREML